ncbi:16S rRNA (guanine(527)-N(7))-methyltransferase RsmG [Glaciecola sp. 1036]|uniref:16S rRNA (guanine(527)-N(7))-methyltransferase RsmG n=1 Tax=Alteromonadaceae TaxID=72275 RepID=UPI003D050032
MSDLLPALQALIAETNLSVTNKQEQQLVGLVNLMHKWNKAYNLSSVRDPNEMLVKHIMDSIVVTPFVSGARVADVGTGPGLPGLPLAIMLPEVEFTLIDSLGKRIRFIKQALFELDIKNVNAIQARVEEFQPSIGFDCILSRAFASMSDMLSWCEHLVAPTGEFLALKGQLNKAELADIPAGFTVVNTEKLVVPQLEGERHLVKIRQQ